MDYATGGQKSVFECPLTRTERTDLVYRIRNVIDTDEDRFCLLRLEPKGRVRTLGTAVTPVDYELIAVV